MAAEEKAKVSRIKVKKKVWCKVLASKLFGQKEIGESYLASPDSAIGRTLKINLKDLTGNMKDQNGYVVFEITKVNGNMLQTTIRGYEITAAFVKRSVRKNTNRLDDYFEFVSKDGKKVVIKSLMITLHKVNRSICSELRRQLQNGLNEEIARNDFEVFFGNLVSNRIQGGLRKRLAKVYPVRDIVLRSVKLDGEGVPAPLPVSEPVAEKMQEIADDAEAEAEVDAE